MSETKRDTLCAECGEPILDESPSADPKERRPCPNCGSTARRLSGEMHATISVSVSANAKLLIGWTEVNRLHDAAEYAAAFLVAAVNVEFILWENLRRFTPIVTLSSPIKSIWGKIRANQKEGVTLGSLLKVASFLSKNDEFSLSPTWEPLVCTINEVRRRIAHERGYFGRLTRLEESDWPEDRIRRVLADAREFCHRNAP